MVESDFPENEHLGDNTRNPTLKPKTNRTLYIHIFPSILARALII